LLKFARAWAAFTDAHSNTSWETSPRHANPRVPSSPVGLSDMRPVFHALNSLMNDTFDQDRDGVSCSRGRP
jgi:hypothetical protein